MDGARFSGWLLPPALFVCLMMLTACGDSSVEVQQPLVSTNGFDWQLPERYPLPVEPLNKPMTEARFQLGRHLFYDRRLSGNGQQACSDCHIQSRGFADGQVTPRGSTGHTLARNSQGLQNVAYHASLTWANPSITTLEQQVNIPLFSDDPVEQGLNDANLPAVMTAIENEARYADLFAVAFPEQGDPIRIANVRDALAAFVRGMVSFDSDFDRFEQGDVTALSADARRGMQLFFGEQLECFHCHGGYLLSDSVLDRSMQFVEQPFHNTGLFNIQGTGDYPSDNTGTFSITGDPADMGKFRSPSLRNVALTAPYMHDGSIATLSQVIDFYAQGGRVIADGPLAGDGRLSPFKSSFVSGFTLTAAQKQDLIAFLESLTDHSFITNPRFRNPWE